MSGHWKIGDYTYCDKCNYEICDCNTINQVDETKKVSEYKSGDLLVIKLEGEVTRCYIFYDYKTNLFGVRLCYFNSKKSRKYNSYYSDNKEVLTEFLLETFSDYKNTAISLHTYKNLPSDSDDITCNFLIDYHDTSNEIIRFEYDEENENDYDEEKYDVEKYPEEKLRSFMNMLEHMYNEY